MYDEWVVVIYTQGDLLRRITGLARLIGIAIL